MQVDGRKVLYAVVGAGWTGAKLMIGYRLHFEPDGEEGRLDVRVVAAIGRALQTGQPQALPPIKSPKLIHAAAPGG